MENVNFLYTLKLHMAVKMPRHSCLRVIEMAKALLLATTDRQQFILSHKFYKSTPGLVFKSFYIHVPFA